MKPFEEILKEYFAINRIPWSYELDQQEEGIYQAVKIYTEQVVELCAEKAYMKFGDKVIPEEWEYLESIIVNEEIIINKDSILKVKELLK